MNTLKQLTIATVLMHASTAVASSHREAPAIAEDQFADNTDVYAFISPNNSEKVVLVANFVPLLIPESGPNFYKFSDSVRYEVCIDNDGDAVRDICYQWKFKTKIGNGDTFLYNTAPVTSINDPALNVQQTYTLVKIDRSQAQKRTVIARDVPVAPWFVGDRSFPANTYEAIAQQAIYTAGETTMFAGPRDEPFFVDLHVFDLLGVGGVPTTDGLNVMSLVLEVPITELAQGGVRPAEGTNAPNSVIGVYARSLRQQLRILNRSPKRGAASEFGGLVQVSRLGWPLVNEVIVPLKAKDVFNRTEPVNDVANFGAFILDPEVPKLLQQVLGLDCDVGGNRADIVELLSPNGTTAADLLRLNIEEGQTFAQSGFPNGRTLTDDVVDILLTVACRTGGPVSDGVDRNDLDFLAQFPFLATPHSGNPL